MLTISYQLYGSRLVGLFLFVSVCVLVCVCVSGVLSEEAGAPRAERRLNVSHLIALRSFSSGRNGTVSRFRCGVHLGGRAGASHKMDALAATRLVASGL